MATINISISCTCSHTMVNFGPLTARDRLASLGHPSKFRRVSCVGFVTAVHRRRSTVVNHTLHDVWPSPGLVHYTGYTFWQLLRLNGILPGAIFTLRPCLVFSYIGSVTGQHSSSGRRPNFAAWCKECNYGTFAPQHFQQRASPIFRHVEH